MITIDPRRANSHQIGIQVGDRTCRIIELKFLWDGDIVVFFRDFGPRQVVVGRYACDGDGNHKTRASLVGRHEWTAADVHYTHHMSGQVHFRTDDKKIGLYEYESESKRRTQPFLSETGHLFTLDIKGLSHFPPIPNGVQTFSHNDPGLEIFGFNQVDVESFHLVARLCTPESLAALEGNLGRNRHLKSWDRILVGSKAVPALFVAPPLTGNTRFRQHSICLTCVEDPSLPVPTWFDKNPESTMVFYGGFDSTREVTDPTQPTEFLVAQFFPATAIKTSLRASG